MKRKIAILRALQLGDMLCSIPAIKAIKDAYPYAEITLIGLPWAKELVNHFFKIFDNFIEFPGHPDLPERKDRKNLDTFFANVKKQNFDLLLQMHGDGTVTNALVAKMGAKDTAGFYKPKKGKKPNHNFFPYPEGVHEIKKLILLVRALHIPVHTQSFVFPVYVHDILRAKNLLGKIFYEDYVCIHPGARDKNKRWSLRYFAEVADKLRQKEIQIVFIGSLWEKELINDIQKHMQFSSVDLSGKTSLGVLGAVLQETKLVICNDSGISHIASGLQKKSIVIFSSFSSSDRWAPLNKKLHHIILPEEVSVESVFAKSIVALNDFHNIGGVIDA